MSSQIKDFIRSNMHFLDGTHLIMAKAVLRKPLTIHSFVQILKNLYFFLYATQYVSME